MASASLGRALNSRLSGTDEFVLKTLQFKTICPTYACTKPQRVGQCHSLSTYELRPSCTTSRYATRLERSRALVERSALSLDNAQRTTGLRHAAAACGLGHGARGAGGAAGAVSLARAPGVRGDMRSSDLKQIDASPALAQRSFNILNTS